MRFVLVCLAAIYYSVFIIIIVTCFCSFMAKQTNDNVFVCGRYTTDRMVCLFHLHDKNIEYYYQTDSLPLYFDCNLCLVTLKIHTKKYIAPCRLASVRCGCDETATFYQSNKDNLNNGSYFFGCPNWKTPLNCKYFSWAREYQQLQDQQVLCRLSCSSNSDSTILNTSKTLESTLHAASLGEDNNQANNALQKRIECIICLSGERSCLISPCNHVCCCSACITKIKDQCPICRGRIGSIQRIFFV